MLHGCVGTLIDVVIVIQQTRINQKSRKPSLVISVHNTFAFPHIPKERYLSL